MGRSHARSTSMRCVVQIPGRPDFPLSWDPNDVSTGMLLTETLRFTRLSIRHGPDHQARASNCMSAFGTEHCAEC